MKSTLFFLIALLSAKSIAQEANTVLLYNTHHDIVKPDKIDLYEETTRNLVAGLEKYDIEIEFFTLQIGDSLYLYFRPFEEMGALGLNSWGKLRPHMPSEYSTMSENFKLSLQAHGSYILELNTGLSYQPDLTGSGRELVYIYFTPEHGSGLADLLKKIKQNFNKNKERGGYRIYEGGYGNVRNYYFLERSKGQADSDSFWNTFSDYKESLLSQSSEIVIIDGSSRDDLSYNGRK